MQALQTLKQKPLILCCLSLLMFVLAWSISFFPITIFIAFAPLFALLDIPENNAKADRMVFGAVAPGTIFAWAFTYDHLIGVVFFGIIVALLFKGFMLAQRVVPTVKKVMIIMAILALEYIVLKVGYLKEPVFIADSLQHVTHWTGWNNYTGYLGMSFWVLIVNLLFYKALFEKPAWHWASALFGVLLLIIPVLISLNTDWTSITRLDMEQVYLSGGYSINATRYLQQGEWMARTATWVSVLMVVFTLIKIRTKK